VKPVEQGEQTLDKDCKCCGYACRGFLCDYCFRERLIDSFHQCKKCKTKPSTTAPSQPELPLIATVESWIEDRTKAVTWGTNNGSSWLGVLTGDLQIILDSLRTIAQLRQDIEKGIEDEVQFRSQIMLMLDKVGIPTTKTDSDKHSRFLTTRLRIKKLITMYAAKDARIAELQELPTVSQLLIVEKEKQMNLGVRCNFMLPNHCQCPNTVVTGSSMCRLHMQQEVTQVSKIEKVQTKKLER
jgi:predicted type IV restriction endonuclease